MASIESIAAAIVASELELSEIDAKRETAEAEESAALAAQGLGEDATQALAKARWDRDCYIEGRRIVESRIAGLKARLAEAEHQHAQAEISHQLEGVVAPAAIELAAALHEAEAACKQYGQAMQRVISASTRAYNAWPAAFAESAYHPQPINKNAFGGASLPLLELAARTHAMICAASDEAWPYLAPPPITGSARTGKEALFQRPGPLAMEFASGWASLLDVVAERPDLAAKVRTAIESSEQRAGAKQEAA